MNSPQSHQNRLNFAFKKYIQRFALASIGFIISACGNSAITSAPSQTAGYEQASFSTKSNMVAFNKDEAWMTSEVGPYWNLTGYYPATHKFIFLTPPGVSQRGGFAIGTNGMGSGIAGFYPYQSMTTSPIFFLKPGDSTWETGTLPNPLLPISDAVALSRNTIYGAVHIGTNKQGIDYGPVAGPFVTVGLPGSDQSISGVYGLSDGVLAVLSNHGSRDIYSFNPINKSWRMVEKIKPSSLNITEFPIVSSSGVATEAVSVCYTAEANKKLLNSQMIEDTSYRANTFRTILTSSISTCGQVETSSNFVVTRSNKVEIYSAGVSSTIGTLKTNLSSTNRFLDLNGKFLSYSLQNNGALSLFSLPKNKQNATPINAYLNGILKKLESSSGE